MPFDVHISENNIEGTVPTLSPSPVITPPKSSSRGPLSDLTGWPSYSVMCTQAPGGGSSGGVRESGGFSSDTPSRAGRGVFQQPSQLPTPQSPGDMSSYLLTDPWTLQVDSSAQISQSSPESSALPTEFRSHPSPSPPPPFRPHQVLTPEASPLVPRSRGNGSHVLLQSMQMNDQDGVPTTPSKRKSSRSREPTPPRTPIRQTLTHPVSPSPQIPVPPASPQHIPTRRSSPVFELDNLFSTHSNLQSSLSQKVADEPGGELTRIRAQLRESHLAFTQEAESRRPEYLKRDSGGKDVSLSRTSANIGIIDSPVKGRRITLFQETSDESFEESLMAGGYGRYRSDGPPWRLDEDTEAPIRITDGMGEDGPVLGTVLSEEEKRKKSRLAAFDSPRASSSKTQLYPVNVEGCGRVLMSLDLPEPQTSPKPSPPKAKRSRKKKKATAEPKQAVDQPGAVALEEPKVDGPNWPDTEFPWRLGSMVQDGHSKAEWEERLRHIESFLERDSDSDEGEGSSSPGWRSGAELTPRSPQPGRGKMYPLLSHSKDRRYGFTTVSVVPSDPADAKTALLSKKSIRAIQLRFLRRQNTNRDAASDGSETVCICRGRDDGRELVQCDGCHTWYHLECIGIHSTSELGKEEDPWFCENCAEVKTPPPVAAALAEPTLVPTDEVEGQSSGSVGFDEGYDPPFFNAGLNPSPAMPWTRWTRPPMTPPRAKVGPYFSSGSSWDGPPSSPRGGPHTPQFSSASASGDMVRVYSTTPGPIGDPLSSLALEESPFDPTSTPSRGIRFGAPFTTPKNGLWGQGLRAGGQDLFHTPGRPGLGGGSSGNWHFARYGQHTLYPWKVGEAQEDGTSGAQGPRASSAHNDSTPVGRNVIGPTRLLESPLGGKRSRRLVDS
ncbi:hypothetical protein BDN67DRAFT_972275 [Paxillus ammoniavirescens]|nr:hypothetical protein BDN67DRAFT_972275 [Paxillus ammoniavirescens]